MNSEQILFDLFEGIEDRFIIEATDERDNSNEEQ